MTVSAGSEAPVLGSTVLVPLPGLLGPGVLWNNCSESATFLPMPDAAVAEGPGREDPEGLVALMVIARERRRLVVVLVMGWGDDDREGESAASGEDLEEDVDDEEDEESMDMGEAERGRGTTWGAGTDFATRAVGDGRPGEETVDRGMSIGSVIARTTTGALTASSVGRAMGLWTRGTHSCTFDGTSCSLSEEEEAETELVLARGRCRRCRTALARLLLLLLLLFFVCTGAAAAVGGAAGRNGGSTLAVVVAQWGAPCHAQGVLVAVDDGAHRVRVGVGMVRLVEGGAG